MATITSTSKRPRLSLQTKSSPAPSRPRVSYLVNPSDPTAFNTLSNVYTTAIERATPTRTEPMTAINTFQSYSITSPVDKTRPRVITPFVACYPESPLSANPSSPLDAYQHQTFPSIMTPTPPLSAGPVEGKQFVFPPLDNLSKSQASSPVLEKKRQWLSPPPYAHPESLHSILRNSPLPAKAALSPTRQSQRLVEKAARRVGYESPLTQEITTNKYTKSHIDLLLEDASPSPCSPFTVAEVSEIPRSAFTANEIQDGGQTPGPMEDIERKMSRFTTSSSPMAGGIRKRKRKEKKRNWVWTIGREEEEGDDNEVGGAIAALRAEAAARKNASDQRVLQSQSGATIVPTIEVHDTDISMADADTTAEAKTPVGPVKNRDTPIPELAGC